MRRRKKQPIFSRGFSVFVVVILCMAGMIGVVAVADAMRGSGRAPLIAPGDGYTPANDNADSGRASGEATNTNGGTAGDESNGEYENTSAQETETGHDSENNQSSQGETNDGASQETGAANGSPYIPIGDITDFTMLSEVDNTQLPWYLKLVNRYNFLTYCFMPNLTPIGNGHYFDSRAYASLLAMLASAREEGLAPIVASSFRSVERQTTLFNNQVQRQRDAGLSQADAIEAARRVVAYPGTSEHNLGLAVDIVALSYQHLTPAQGQTPEGRWLAQNSHRYGFVLRYPYDKQHITNIIYEPWHFRYVGVASATTMFELGLVLEEYVSKRLTGR